MKTRRALLIALAAILLLPMHSGGADHKAVATPQVPEDFRAVHVREAIDYGLSLLEGRLAESKR